MDEHFEPAERLFRSIKPQSAFISESGELSSAAFKDAKGASVDRQGDRSIQESADFLRKKKPGMIVYVKVADCTACNALVVYCPEADDIWHSQIQKNEEELKLTRHQLRALASAAVRVD